MKTKKEIIESFPNLFVNCHLSPKQSCMAFGIECGDGWNDIIYSLCSFLHKPSWSTTVPLDTKDGIKMFNYKYPNIVFDQIKEKFGVLIIYYSVKIPELDDPTITDTQENADKLNRIYSEITSYVDGAIEFASYLSSITCEISGKPSSLRNVNGWYTTALESEEKSSPNSK